MKFRTSRYLLLMLTVLVFLIPVIGYASGEVALLQVQEEREINVLPAALERLSWSAVLAGSIFTLIFMFLLNLIGTAVGMSQINPQEHDSPDGQTLATGALVWIGVSNLLALFAGGWLAAYFAGVPEPLDGLLHGLMVWALTGLATILLVMSGLGRIMNGLAGLVSSGLRLTGSAASGAAHLAGGVAQTAGSAVGSVGNLTAQTLSTLAHGVQSSAHMVREGASNLSDTAIENSPDVQNALAYQDLAFDEIRVRAGRLLRSAVRDPERVQQQAGAAVNDVKVAAQQAIRDPEHADQVLNIALQRVLRRGEDLASDVDRDALVNLLTENTDMTYDEASQQVQRWEEQFQTVKQQTAQVRDTARQRAEELRQQAEQKAQEIYHQAQERAEEMQREIETRMNEVRAEAEEKAREAAQEASDAFAKIAAAIAVAMVVGAIAAGLGGYIGAPEELPDVTVEEAATDIFTRTSFHQ